jgi:hypothetical protein
MIVANLFLLYATLAFQKPAQDTSLFRAWQFSASCADPSTSLNGTLNIVFDSASYVVGILKVNGHTMPLHGRHLASRLAARTDDGYYPVLRLDCTPDSLGHSLSGVLQASKINAVDSRKHYKDFYTVMFDFYAVRP